MFPSYISKSVTTSPQKIIDIAKRYKLLSSLPSLLYLLKNNNDLSELSKLDMIMKYINNHFGNFEISSDDSDDKNEWEEHDNTQKLVEYLRENNVVLESIVKEIYMEDSEFEKLLKNRKNEIKI